MGGSDVDELRRMLHDRAIQCLDGDRLDLGDEPEPEVRVDEVWSWAEMRPLNRIFTLVAPPERVTFVGAERVT